MLIYKRVERYSGDGDTILDIGAKGGSNITDTEASVVAIDIEFSKSTDGSEIEYLYGDGRKLPFRNNVFDYIVLNQVIEHVDGRPALFREVKRVLKKDGIALFSFPNRLALNKPHGLPRITSIIPKPIGLRLGRLVLNDTQYNYYKSGLFPLSPIGARLELRKQFDSVEYITIDESIKSKQIYDDRFAPQVFVFCLPAISIMTKFIFVQAIFELVWGYVGYECNS